MDRVAKWSITDFVEVYVKCPLDVLRDRDPKGLYARALAGDLPNFTGVSDPYEEPLNPDHRSTLINKLLMKASPR